jgi:hypothetical protein
MGNNRTVQLLGWLEGKEKNNLIKTNMSVLVSMFVVAFQIAFCVEIHANDVFLFFKNYF